MYVCMYMYIYIYIYIRDTSRKNICWVYGGASFFLAMRVYCGTMM